MLPDATLGVPYQGRLVTSHNAGGALSIVAGALPAGRRCPPRSGPPATSSAVPSPSRWDDYNTYTFTVQGTGDQGQPLYQAYQISVDPDQPLTITCHGGATLPPAMVGGAYARASSSAAGPRPTPGRWPPG